MTTLEVKNENLFLALKNLAMTSMRSELGKIKLDDLFQSRSELNKRIRTVLESQIHNWGLECHRYEILRIEPPKTIKRKMQLEAEAERLKRKEIILSEADKLSKVIVAEGNKESEILVSEARAKVKIPNFLILRQSKLWQIPKEWALTSSPRSCQTCQTRES